MSNYFLVSTKCYSESQKCKDFMHIKSSRLDHGCILAPHEYASVVNVPPLLSLPLVPGILFNLLFFFSWRTHRSRSSPRQNVHTRDETMVCTGRNNRCKRRRRLPRDTLQPSTPTRSNHVSNEPAATRPSTPPSCGPLLFLISRPLLARSTALPLFPASR